MFWKLEARIENWYYLLTKLVLSKMFMIWIVLMIHPLFLKLITSCYDRTILLACQMDISVWNSSLYFMSSWLRKVRKLWTVMQNVNDWCDLEIPGNPLCILWQHFTTTEMLHHLIMLLDHVVNLAWCCYGNSHIECLCSAFILKLFMSSTIHDLFHAAPSYSHESLAHAENIFPSNVGNGSSSGCYLYFTVSNSTW